MKRFLLVFGFFLCLGTSLQAQCFKIDSLRRVLIVWQKRDSVRVNTLNALAREYIIDRRFQNAEYYSQQAFRLANQIKFEEGKADALMVLGDVYFDDPFKRDEESIESYKNAIAIYDSISNVQKLTEGQRIIGDYYYDLFYIRDDYYSMALEYYTKCYENSLKIPDPVQAAEVCFIIGQLHDILGNNKESQQFFLKAVEFKREIEEKDIDDPHLFSKAESYYKLQIENQQLNNYLLIGGIGLMTLIMTLLGIFGWQQRKANKQLKSQKSEISQQNKAIEKKNEALEKQTEEISSQRDQLALQNQQIKEAQEEIEAANHKLMNMNQGLEHLVEERTQDLRKTNEALVLANEELDTLIYRASHDFKGPVATLTGLSNIARMEADQNSRVRPLIDRIENTAYKMDEMLEKLHTVSYIIGKDLQNEIIAFEKIVEDIKSNYSEAIQKDKVEFEVEIPPHLYFYSDQELVSSIMENLVENSLQFRTQDSARSPKISIRVFEENQSIYLEMSDNGAGIPDEYKQRVFDMFFRGSEDSKGNGLGLYVVKKALERLKAEVDIQSQVGEYTSFKIQFPN